MLAIRFYRTGKKHQPSFKIVVTDKKRPPRGGRFVEKVGFWNPLTKEKNLNKERIEYWLSVGAKPSVSVYNLLVSENILKGKKIPKHKKKKEKKTESEEKKPQEKPEEKPEEKTPEKPEEKVEEGAEGKPQEKPEEKPSSGA